MSTSTDFWRGFTLAAAIFFSHLRFKDSQPALGLQTHGFIQKTPQTKTSKRHRKTVPSTTQRPLLTHRAEVEH